MMGGGAADEERCDGERAGVAGREWSEAMVENRSGRVGFEASVASCDTIGVLWEACAMGRGERIGAGIGTGDDDQIESCFVAEFGVQNAGMGSFSQPVWESDIEEDYNHLFTDAMKLQLRAQILVL